MLGLATAALLIPILPFVLFGSVLEPEITRRLDSPFWQENPGWTVLSVIGCLVADILLPIPSSNVCTFAGRIFGSLQGAVVSWIGLSLSCGIGYLLGYRLGWPIARRFSDDASLAEMQKQLARRGPLSLALFRGVPVLAEASVLVAGTLRISALRFWPPVLASNLGLAIAYSVLGEIAGNNEWFGLAMGIALGLPAALLVGWILIVRSNSPEQEKASNE